MVTGVAPFTGDSPVAVAFKHVREAPVPPSRRNPEVEDDLEQVILTAIAKDPSLRYQSADDMRADLLRYRRGRPLAAAPVTALVYDSRESRRTVANPRVTGAYSEYADGAPATATTGTLVPGRSRRTRALITIATFLVLILIAGLVFLIAQTAGDKQSKANVPNVVGFTSASAKTQIEQAGFVATLSTAPSTKVAKNVVISQDPKGDTQLKKGGTVKLVISSGSGNVAIADVTGKSVDDATGTLEAQGLQVTPTFEANDSIAVGLVVRTDPAAGQSVPAGSNVSLVVSSGPANVGVPNVLNESSTAAAAQLGQAGFQVHVVNEASATVPTGNVIRTDPGPNTPAPKGSTVTLVVSTGPQQVTVPSVVGKTQADATAQLQAAGLTVSVVNQPGSKHDVGRVIDQTPSASASVNAGSTVVIVVGTESTTSSSGATTTTT
jgi:serine/threonine-protein kinase